MTPLNIVCHVPSIIMSLIRVFDGSTSADIYY